MLEKKYNHEFIKILNILLILLFSSPIFSAYCLDNSFKQSTSSNIGYENVLTKEVSSDEFVELLIENINKERTSRGLLPLVNDPIAARVASEHSKELIMLGHLSYYNSNNQGPDERYTLAGGTGALIEIVKGFTTEQSVRLNELLSIYLLEALEENHDDSNILFSPYLTHIGCGFSISHNKKIFISVIEFLTKGGEFEPITSVVSLGSKINISGKVNHPFKFKAVSIAYFDRLRNIEQQHLNLNSESFFNSENLIPYFPPQDYIAYADTSKANLMKILKGLGVIGAIGASPFTGGATAVFAPVLLSSIQTGPPKEIPLKGGIDLMSNGNFSGEVELNYQGKTGLYFISVLGELLNIPYPVVISRRTIFVKSPLAPVTLETEKYNKLVSLK